MLLSSYSNKIEIKTEVEIVRNTLWNTETKFEKVSKNLYLCELSLINLGIDTVYLEVPYPYSIDISLSQSYFSSENWGIIRNKNFYFNGENEIDTLFEFNNKNKIIGYHKNKRDFILIEPKKKVHFKFYLKCFKEYRKIIVAFTYSNEKNNILTFDQTLRINNKKIIIEADLKKTFISRINLPDFENYDNISD